MKWWMVDLLIWALAGNPNEEIRCGGFGVIWAVLQSAMHSNTQEYYLVARADEITHILNQGDWIK